MSIENEIKQHQFSTSYEKLAFNLIYSCRWLEAFLKQRFGAYDLTMQQYNTLRILRGARPLPLSTQEIRNRLIDKMSDTSRIVDRLIVKKLVTKSVNDVDNRLVDVIITDRGLKLLEQLDTIDDQIAVHLNQISEEEALLVSNLLDKMHSKV